MAVDPRTGFVYLTEDARYTSGLYRFRPTRPELFGLEHGGVLEMLRVRSQDNAELLLVEPRQEFEVEWVPVAEPEAGPVAGVGPFGSFDGQTTSASGPFMQGFAQGGARFRRLEGIVFDPVDEVFTFTDTEGGVPAEDTGRPEGSVWRYDPRREELRVLHVSRFQSELDNPDNVAVSPRGGILLCEDGDLIGQRLVGLAPDGGTFAFAQNDVVLDGQRNGIAGDFRGSEWAGATFDRAGRWLFANIQNPGITFAITGPWNRGAL